MTNTKQIISKCLGKNNLSFKNIKPLEIPLKEIMESEREKYNKYQAKHREKLKWKQNQ